MRNTQEGSSDHHDPTVMVSSSIALLQERFRQLQKVKEIREGKKLLRLVSDSDQSFITTAKQYSPAAWQSTAYHHHHSPEQRPIGLHDYSLHQGLNLPVMQADHYHDGNKARAVGKFWPKDVGGSSSKPDVDTSLHL